ncbi:HesA/MoeB/ThiF family protein [Liquorilactobacillus satsumensis]|uniref:HesA/MoeB/ThiF family protein n=1 Tax=Liquorilactobacillus satsumensis TaxID=259059 RepID=UPI0039EB9847
MLNRYDRQTRVSVIGEAGQQAINKATILIAGVGALGSYAAEQLVRAGVKKLILVDPDIVTLTNLQRQALFTEIDVQQHRLKVVAAQSHLKEINHHVQIDVYPEPLDFTELVAWKFDLALDCLDNFSARATLNEAALFKGFDYIFASCTGTFGNVMPLSPTKHPCLKCLFPNLTELEQTDCELLGVNSALVPLVSALQVSLALRYLIAPATVDFTKLITIDNWRLEQQHFNISKNLNCSVCQSPLKSTKKAEKPFQLHELCGSKTYLIKLEKDLTVKLLKNLNQQKTKKQKYRFFVSFKWESYSCSVFKNGKVLLYGFSSLSAANLFLKKFLNDLSTQQFSSEVI